MTKRKSLFAMSAFEGRVLSDFFCYCCCFNFFRWNLNINKSWQRNFILQRNTEGGVAAVGWMLSVWNGFGWGCAYHCQKQVSKAQLFLSSSYPLKLKYNLLGSTGIKEYKAWANSSPCSVDIALVYWHRNQKPFHWRGKEKSATTLG